MNKLDTQGLRMWSGSFCQGGQDANNSGINGRGDDGMVGYKHQGGGHVYGN